MSKESQLSRAFDKLNMKHRFTPAQQKWLQVIRSYLKQQDILSVDAFNEDKRFTSKGGYKTMQKVFGSQFDALVKELNGYLFEDGGKTA